MQSSKKSPVVAHRIPTYTFTRGIARRKSSATQTDHILGLSDKTISFNALPPSKAEIFNEETKETYSKALRYINSCNGIINKYFEEKYAYCGEGNESVMKVPDIPNYITWFELVSKTGKKDKENVFGTRTNLCSLPESTAADVKGNHSRSTINSTKGFGVNEDTEEIDITKYKKDDLKIYPKTEIPTNPKSSRNTLISNLSVDGKPFTWTESENLDTFNQRPVTSPGPTKGVSKECLGDLIKEQLLSLISLKKQSEVQPKRNLRVCNFKILNIPPAADQSPNQAVAAPCKEIANSKSASQINLFNIQANTVLEKKKQSVNTQFLATSITGLFKKENMQMKTDLKSVKTFEGPRHHHNQNITSSNRATPVKKINSEDSVILDDEEFEKLEKLSTVRNVEDQIFRKVRPKIRVKLEKKVQLPKTVIIKEDTSHPLKLNGRDLDKLDKRTLQKIGIFQENGDLRPEIYKQLESKHSDRNNKNKKFRAKRQYDIQYHMNPKTSDGYLAYINVSSESSSSAKTFSSSDIRSDSDLMER